MPMWHSRPRLWTASGSGKTRENRASWSFGCSSGESVLHVSDSLFSLSVISRCRRQLCSIVAEQMCVCPRFHFPLPEAVLVAAAAGPSNAAVRPRTPTLSGGMRKINPYGADHALSAGGHEKTPRGGLPRGVSGSGWGRAYIPAAEPRRRSRARPPSARRVRLAGSGMNSGASGFSSVLEAVVGPVRAPGPENAGARATRRPA